MNYNVLFLGDISLNNGYIKLAKDGINPFSSIEPLLKDADLIIGNLECLLEGNQGENLAKKPRLKTEISAFKLLKALRVDHVALAHNHIADNLEDGVEKTLEFLASNGIGAFGFSKEDGVENSDYYPININEKKIAILNYVTDDTHPAIPYGFKFRPNSFNREKIISLINSIREDFDFIVAYLHWGGRVEGGRYPDWGQNNIAHAIIDAGADLIVGHHPHVIQPMEVYKSKHIYYSLGNFCFDDVFSDGDLHPLSSDRKIGLIVKLNISDENINCSEVFVKNDNLMIIPFPTFSSVFGGRNRVFKILSKCRMIWLIYYLKLVYIIPISEFITRKDLSINIKLKRIIRSLLKKKIKGMGCKKSLF